MTPLTYDVIGGISDGVVGRHKKSVYENKK